MSKDIKVRFDGNGKHPFENWLKQFIMQTTATFEFAGEMFVNLARVSGNYTDRTGNLRSSIGYIVSHNGRPIKKKFSQAGTGSDGSDGVRKAEELAASLIGQVASGFALIGVAGMDYAAAVENLKGYDVITGSAQNVEEWLKKALKAAYTQMTK